MNHFGYPYPLTIVQVNTFEEPQNIFSQPRSQTQGIEPASPFRIFNWPLFMLFLIEIVRFKRVDIYEKWMYAAESSYIDLKVSILLVAKYCVIKMHFLDHLRDAFKWYVLFQH